MKNTTNDKITTSQNIIILQFKLKYIFCKRFNIVTKTNLSSDRIRLI